MTITLSLLSAALTDPLLQGQVTVPGVQVVPAKSVDDNSRRMLDGAFDIAEMSFATFVRATAQDDRLIGLPVFPGRRFVHEGMLVHRDAGISSPRDLVGRRVAVPQYWLTSSVWHRGLLRDEYGVDEKDIDWFTIAPERGDAPTPPARVTHVDGTTVAELVMQRCVDAALMPRQASPQLIQAGAISLLPDAQRQQKAYFERTGVMPILHFIAMRRSLAVAQPQLVRAVCEAFERSADAPGSTRLEAYRPSLDRFLHYVREQGLVSSPLVLDDLFVPELGRQEVLA